MERGFSSGSRSNNNYRLFMVFSSHSFFFFFIFSHSSHSLLPSHNNKNNNNKNNNNYERPRRNSLLNSFYCYIEIFICPRQEFFPSLSLTHSISLFVGFEREQFRMFLMDIWKFMYLFHIRCAQFCCFFCEISFAHFILLTKWAFRYNKFSEVYCLTQTKYSK